MPATTFLEREDIALAHQNLMLEPYVQWTEAVIPPRGEARHEWQILSEIGDAMGLRFMNNPWLDRMRKLLKRMRRPLTPPGHWAEADPAAHVRWYKDLGANCIQTFVLSCNGYAWYKGGPIPAQPGLKNDFLAQVVRFN